MIKKTLLSLVVLVSQAVFASGYSECNRANSSTVKNLTDQVVALKASISPSNVKRTPTSQEEITCDTVRNNSVSFMTEDEANKKRREIEIERKKGFDRCKKSYSDNERELNNCEFKVNNVVASKYHRIYWQTNVPHKDICEQAQKFCNSLVKDESNEIIRQGQKVDQEDCNYHTSFSLSSYEVYNCLTSNRNFDSFKACTNPYIDGILDLGNYPKSEDD